MFSDWLPEHAGWVYLACPWFLVWFPLEKISLGHIINTWMAKLFNLVKMVRFWQFNDLDFIVNHNNGKTNKQIKKNWPIWAMDTSCLFTNAYVSVPQVRCFLIGHRRVNTTSLFIIIPHCFTVRVWNQLTFRVRRADHDPSVLRSPFPHLSPYQPKRDFH